jgi:hypothetical protein
MTILSMETANYLSENNTWFFRALGQYLELKPNELTEAIVLKKVWFYQENGLFYFGKED